MRTSIYNHIPITVDYANGSTITDITGQSYQDTFSGIGVMLLGHSFPGVLSAMQEKMCRYMHVSNYFLDPDATMVEAKLLAAANLDGKVYFTNSGAEATESAIRVIKKKEEKKKNIIIHFTGSFHGRTTGALSLLGNKKIKHRFGQLLPNIKSLNWNDHVQFQRFMEQNCESVLAIFIEPVQGSGGINLLSKEMSASIKYYHNETNFILVCDEIQSGLGRTGCWFSYQHWGLEPNIVLVGKGLGGGLPLGGAIFSSEIFQDFEPGDHGSTFAPNPISLAGAKVVLGEIPVCMNHINQIDSFLDDLLRSELDEVSTSIRRKGFMVGIDPLPCKKDVQTIAREVHHLLLNITPNGAIRLLPPLNTSKTTWFSMINALKKSLQECI
ncbi:MAG: aminotransferase class III-fold pyridoxal phosphate-dependent enzyme [Caldisericia bacterium]|nr:aminotransferase class III-fold pyridoxal phosphate-dependent enzyme [Caldisericia bacterium]